MTGRIFTASTVAEALRLPEHRLHELAWLVGNDVSSDLLDKHAVPKRLGIPTVTTKTKGHRCLLHQKALLHFSREFLMMSR